MTTVGTKAFSYEASTTWHKLPPGMRLHESPGVGVNSRDEVFVLTRNTDNPMIVFDREGNFLRTWGKGTFSNRTHGVFIGPGAILTNDYNLNRVAELQGVRVLNINSLANAVKPAVLPGEELRVRVIQEGKEPGQGVGFLDDGTMIVIEGGARHIDRELDVSVTRVLQTVAGRMIFAQPHLD